jgi:hypothetical protein
LVRSATVDFTEILDRTVQELGEDVHTFIATLERVRGRQLPRFGPKPAGLDSAMSG